MATEKTRRSTDRTLTIPVRKSPEALAAMPRSDALTFLTTEYDRPFTSAESFGPRFDKWCIEADLEPALCDDGRTRNFRAHVCGSQLCIELAENDCTAPQIQALSSHSSLDKVQVYIDEVNRQRLAIAKTEPAIAKLETGGSL